MRDQSYLETPDGVRLRVSLLGGGENAIVLVHGWKGSHRMWDPAVYRLVEDFRVMALDTRGMGESDKPGGRYDFEVLAVDLAFALEAADLSDVTLVGWSMGCSISLEYMARHGGRVGRLVLVNGPIKLENDDDFEFGLPPGQLERYVDELVAGWPGSERDFARGALRDPEDPFADLYYRVALQTPLERSIRIVREQARLDHRPVLRELGVPVLAIYGRHDPYYPTELAAYIAEQVPDGRCLILEESAHVPHFDEPDRFCEAIGRFARGELE